MKTVSGSGNPRPESPPLGHGVLCAQPSVRLLRRCAGAAGLSPGDHGDGQPRPLSSALSLVIGVSACSSHQWLQAEGKVLAGRACFPRLGQTGTVLPAALLRILGRAA